MTAERVTSNNDIQGWKWAVERRQGSVWYSYNAEDQTFSLNSNEDKHSSHDS